MLEPYFSCLEGLMISGLSRTAQVLNDPDYLQRAVNAAKFVKKNLFDVNSGCLLRSSYKGSEGGVEQM